MAVKLYVYSVDSGAFEYEDSGNPSYVLHDIDADKDFTLTPPPDYEQPWYWVDDKWTTEQPS